MRFRCHVRTGLRDIRPFASALPAYIGATRRVWVCEPHRRPVTFANHCAWSLAWQLPGFPHPVRPPILGYWAFSSTKTAIAGCALGALVSAPPGRPNSSCQWPESVVLLLVLRSSEHDNGIRRHLAKTRTPPSIKQTGSDGEGQQVRRVICHPRVRSEKAGHE